TGPRRWSGRRSPVNQETFGRRQWLGRETGDNWIGPRLVAVMPETGHHTEVILTMKSLVSALKTVVCGTSLTLIKGPWLMHLLQTVSVTSIAGLIFAGA